MKGSIINRAISLGENASGWRLGERWQTVIMVTHDFRAASYADRVLVLRDGRIRGETRLQGNVDTQRALHQLLDLEGSFQ